MTAPSSRPRPGLVSILLLGGLVVLLLFILTVFIGFFAKNATTITPTVTSTATLDDTQAAQATATASAVTSITPPMAATIAVNGTGAATLAAVPSGTPGLSTILPVTPAATFGTGTASPVPITGVPTDLSSTPNTAQPTKANLVVTP